MRITTRVTGFKIHSCNVCDELQEGETVAIIKEGERIAVYRDYLGLNRCRIGFVPEDSTMPQIEAAMNRTDSRVVAVIDGIYDGIDALDRKVEYEVSIDVYTVIDTLDRATLVSAVKNLIGFVERTNQDDSFRNGYQWAIIDVINIIEAE